MPPINHKLPETPGAGDTTWFTARQNPFEQQEIRRQVDFKTKHWPQLPPLSSHRGSRHHYPHILPDEPGMEQLAYFPGFAAEALAYMRAEDIATHTEALNLKSSQAACINFLYPLRWDFALAARVLRPILPDITTVTGLEFEYTGQDETTRAGRTSTDSVGGKRGQHRTSIDAAIFWTDTRQQTHITLIEWKYTERNFGTCSAYQKAEPDVKARCRSLNVTSKPAANCDLAGPGRRRPWPHPGSHHRPPDQARPHRKTCL